MKWLRSDHTQGLRFAEDARAALAPQLRRWCRLRTLALREAQPGKDKAMGQLRAAQGHLPDNF